jgi:cell division protein FtsQ
VVRTSARPAGHSRRSGRRRPFADARTLPLVVGGALVVLVAGGGARVAWRAVRGHSYFVVQRIEVRGAERVPPAEIRARAGIPEGGTIWRVDLEAVRRRVLRHPWVADVEVRREPPDAVVIAVRERELVAVLSDGGARVGVDRHGHAFAVLPPAVTDSVPGITGVSVGDGGEVGGGAAGSPHTLRAVARLLRVLGPRHHVRTVHVDTDTGVTLRMGADGAIPVAFGWGAWHAKRRRLDAVLGVWAGREDDLRAISVAGADQVVVRLRRGAT